MALVLVRWATKAEFEKLAVPFEENLSKRWFGIVSLVQKNRLILLPSYVGVETIKASMCCPLGLEVVRQGRSLRSV